MDNLLCLRLQSIDLLELLQKIVYLAFFLQGLSTVLCESLGFLTLAFDSEGWYTKVRRKEVKVTDVYMSVFI